MVSYPKLAPEDTTGDHYEEEDEQENAYVPTLIVETNTQCCVLHAQLQQQLYSVLQTSFGEHEKEISVRLRLFMTGIGEYVILARISGGIVHPGRLGRG